MPKARGDRLRILGISLLLGLSLLWLRAAQLTILDHEELKRKADRQQKRVRSIPSLRGAIVDRTGTPLAFSVGGSSLAVDPTRLEDPVALAETLEAFGILEASEVLASLDVGEQTEFVWLTRRAIPEEIASKLEEQFQPALIRWPEPKRLYPFGAAGAAVVGATGVDGNGLVGIEARYERLLHGTDGRMIDFRSGSEAKHHGPGRVILSRPEIGSAVQLTIDARFQQIVDARLREAVEEQEAAGGAAILIDPRTGAILALSSMPGFDPEAIGEADSIALRNWGVSQSYEPGSTYKIVAFAAALEAGVLTPEDSIDCYGGKRRVPGGTIRDHEPFEILSVWEVLAQSSNIGTGVIAEIVGEEGFYRMERLLGFGVPTGVEIPGEERGWIPDPSSWSGRSLVTQAFGQEVSCTVLQLAMAYATVANGGLLMRPYVVREVRGEDGRLLERREPEILRRAIRPETARTLREMMRRVVTDGTGRMAEVEGLRPAGKTGTGQKFIREEGGYSNERYVASYVGFAPSEAPRWLCVVVLDEPRSSIWGGSVAAPVFAGILDDVAQLELRRSRSPGRRIELPRPEDSVVQRVPRLVGLPAGLGRRQVKQEGLIPRFVGRGERIIASEPASGRRCQPGEVVTIYLDGEGGIPGSPSELPDLLGLSLRDVVLRARWHRLPLRIEGTGWVVEQRPEAGTPLDQITDLVVRLSPDSSRAYADWERVRR